MTHIEVSVMHSKVKKIHNCCWELGTRESILEPMTFELSLEDKEDVNGLIMLQNFSR